MIVSVHKINCMHALLGLQYNFSNSILIIINKNQVVVELFPISLIYQNLIIQFKLVVYINEILNSL